MISPQIFQSNLVQECHNELLREAFNSLIKNVYDLLIQHEHESETNIYSSNIEPTHFRICQKYQHDLSNAISSRHCNYHDLQLINSNFENCYGLNIPNIFNNIGGNSSQIKTPFVVLKINAPQLMRYLEDDVRINDSYNNMQLTFELNDRHKIKVCKYKDADNCYVVIFFDSLNYNDSHVFTDHNVIENLNSYNNVLFRQQLVANPLTQRFIFNPTIQRIEERYAIEFEKILPPVAEAETI